MSTPARIIAVANQKGGVGKTTTVVNLAASLAAAEKRVLAVDLDPQGNLSSGLGYPKDRVERETYHALTGEAPLGELLLDTDLPLLKLAPATPELTGAEVELVSVEDRHRRLADQLEGLVDDFDVVLIDTPPSLGLLTLNALVAARTVLIPLQCEYYALEGLSHLITTIDRVQQALNPELALEGIVFCMYDGRMNLTRQVAQEVQEHFPDEVLQTVIPRNVRLGESPSFGKPVLLYDINSTGARSYLQLAKELMQRWDGPADAESGDNDRQAEAEAGGGAS